MNIIFYFNRKVKLKLYKIEDLKKKVKNNWNRNNFMLKNIKKLDSAGYASFNDFIYNIQKFEKELRKTSITYCFDLKTIL